MGKSEVPEEADPTVVLYLTESDVDGLITMGETIDAVEAAMAALAGGRAENRPRQRAVVPGATPMLHVLAAAHGGLGRVGLKAYTTGGQGARFWVLLWDAGGQLLALMAANRLGQVRTGAASGVATQHLARPDASTVGQIGSGWQARTQLAAVCAVRSVKQARVWSRTPEHCVRFCAEMTAALGIPVDPAPGPAEAVEGADIINTITNASSPLLRGEWIQPGAHLNVAGSNRAGSREVDAAVVARADRVVVDDLEQARVESGDLIAAVAEGAFRWDQATPLAAVVGQLVPGRTRPEEITLFKSNGIGLWDVAAADLIYRKATALGVGSWLPLPDPGSEGRRSR